MESWRGLGKNSVENTPKLKSALAGNGVDIWCRVTHRHAAAVKPTSIQPTSSSKKTTTFGFYRFFSQVPPVSAGFLCLVQELHHRHHVVGNSGRRFNQILVG